MGKKSLEKIIFQIFMWTKSMLCAFGCCLRAHWAGLRLEPGVYVRKHWSHCLTAGAKSKKVKIALSQIKESSKQVGEGGLYANSPLDFIFSFLLHFSHMIFFRSNELLLSYQRTKAQRLSVVFVLSQTLHTFFLNIFTQNLSRVVCLHIRNWYILKRFRVRYLFTTNFFNVVCFSIVCLVTFWESCKI